MSHAELREKIKKLDYGEKYYNKTKNTTVYKEVLDKEKKKYLDLYMLNTYPKDSSGNPEVSIKNENDKKRFITKSVHKFLYKYADANADYLLDTFFNKLNKNPHIYTIQDYERVHELYEKFNLLPSLALSNEPLLFSFLETTKAVNLDATEGKLHDFTASDFADTLQKNSKKTKDLFTHDKKVFLKKLIEKVNWKDKLKREDLASKYKYLRFSKKI